VSISSVEREIKRLAEIVTDAKKRTDRLSTWECDFLRTLESMAANGKGTLDLSEKQLECFEKLERKIYVN
jgi:hypothetical protein